MAWVHGLATAPVYKGYYVLLGVQVAGYRIGPAAESVPGFYDGEFGGYKLLPVNPYTLPYQGAASTITTKEKKNQSIDGRYWIDSRISRSTSSSFPRSSPEQPTTQKEYPQPSQDQGENVNTKNAAAPDRTRRTRVHGVHVTDVAKNRLRAHIANHEGKAGTHHGCSKKSQRKRV